jgi:precorrin-6y C5,15-methyltransferase (decarboxylating), CbiE subunit
MKLNIVGIGPGDKKYILPIAIETIENSHLVIGFKRAIESIDFIKTKKMQVETLKEINDFILRNDKKIISIVASGDPGFYGILEYIKKNYKGHIEIVPGISSFQYFFAKIKKSWQGIPLGSLHGREQNFVEIVKREKISFWLTDKVSTPSYICERLIAEGIKGTMYIGENLSYEDEKITIVDFRKALDMKFSELSVIIIDRKGEEA